MTIQIICICNDGLTSYAVNARLKDSMASVDFALTALLLFNVLVSEDVKRSPLILTSSTDSEGTCRTY